MTPSFNKVHDKFKYNGLHFNFEALKQHAQNLVALGEAYEKDTGSFLLDWLNAKDYIYVNTSGSTGTPKSIKLSKLAMVNSAIATGDFFSLQSGDKALHCLPSHYIAGKMMLVRALILGLELDAVKPTTQLVFKYTKQYHFCAMVPLQLQQSINFTECIKTIIVGGSKVQLPLLEKIKALKSNIFETYGMTETVTHVALKQLQSKTSKGETSFKALPNITFSKDDRGCLVINAPKLVNEALVTNDSVDLQSDTSFKLLGRFDNVINSGGVKLFPEQIEAKLQHIIKDRFIIAAQQDASLGEKLILVIENPSESIAEIASKIKKLKTLDKFEIPKVILPLNAFFETESGKIQRTKTVKAVLS